MRHRPWARRACSLAAVLTFTTAAAAQGPAPSGPRAFSIGDFYRLRPVLEPDVSPDGRTIVYTVTSRDLEGAKQDVHLWRVGADGAGARALTTGDTTNQQPAFSPDG